MSFNPDPVSLINLSFCIVVVLVSFWWSARTGSRTPLFIGMAFGLFGVSHLLVLLNLNKPLELALIFIRIAAYAFVTIGTFFVALEVMKRKKAEDELLLANENLRTANEQLRMSGEDLKNNLEELRKKKVELLESERKFRSVFDTFIDIYYQTDMEGTILMVSPSCKRMSGWEPDELIGTNSRDLFPDVQQRETLIAELIKKGAVQDYHVQLKNSEGRYIDASLSSHIICDSGGNPVRAEGTIRDHTERKAAEDALALAKKKLSLLNTVTFQDIQNAVFSLNGYFQLQQQKPMDETLQGYLAKEMEIVMTITDSLKFAGQYQSMGLSPPGWQNVHHAFLYGISHLDLTGYTRTISIEGLEIYADPMLENVFFTLAENVVLNAKAATEISLTYHDSPEGLTVIFADNGQGIPPKMKEKIFERRYEKGRGIGLFLAREILSITGITIRETGVFGEGARFEMLVPKGGYRFVSKKEK
jgi:PAS domain S-box-containing protein